MAAIEDLKKGFKKMMESENCNNSSFSVDRDTIRGLQRGKGYISTVCTALDDYDYTILIVPNKTK